LTAARRCARLAALTGAETTQAQAQAAFGEGPGARRGPSVLWYWIGGALCVAAVAGAVLWLVLGIVGFSDAVDDLQRVPAPGRGVVELGAGRHAIYFESPAGADAPIPPLRLALRPVAGGEAVPIGPYSGTVTYSTGGHDGRSLAGFAVAEPGRYRLTVAGEPARTPGAVVAVGRGLGGRLVRAIVGAAVIFVGGLALGGVVIGVTSARRSRSARGQV
jgi:hypothetical protein